MPLFFPNGEAKRRIKSEDCLSEASAQRKYPWGIPHLPAFCAGGGKEKNNRHTILWPTFLLLVPLRVKKVWEPARLKGIE